MPISTFLMSLQPSDTIFNRFRQVQRQKKPFPKAIQNQVTIEHLESLEKKLPDILLMNQEFACNSEIMRLSRHFGKSDFEFILVSAPYYARSQDPDQGVLQK